MRHHLLIPGILAVALSLACQAQVAQQKVVPKPPPPKTGQTIPRESDKVKPLPFHVAGHIISGNIGGPVPGVTVAATSAIKTVTDGSGNFSLPPLDGSVPQYTLKLSKPGCTFSPTTQNVKTVAGGDAMVEIHLIKYSCGSGK
jgi:hypothetical protein